MESCDEVEFIFVWRIENLRYCALQNGTAIDSPKFSLKTFHSTTWYLGLYPKGKEKEDEEYMACFLYRTGDKGPKSIDVICKLSVGSISRQMTHSFPEIQGFGYRKFLSRNSEILKEEFVVVECHMRRSSGSIVSEFNEVMSIHNSPLGLKPVQLETEIMPEVVKDLQKVRRKVYICPTRCFAVSQFLVEKKFCIWPINDHLISESKGKQINHILSYTEVPCLVITLCTNRQEDEDFLVIDISLLEGKVHKPLMLVCKMLILDSAGNAIHSAEEEHFFNIEHGSEVWRLKGLLKLSDLKQKANTSCTNQLSLSCEFTFSFGDVHSGIKWTSSDQRLESAPKNTTQCSLSSETSRLYNEKKFCDVVLRTRDKAFDVHKIVLCAMSPVFSSMFSSNMTESSTNVVNIDDLEEDTVSQMLSFMYTETLDQLEFDSAKKLFAAADKYQILPMKKLCRNFLMSNITKRNVYVVLSLADVHNDLKLKNAGIEFVTNHKNYVLLSPEWKVFEEHNRILANEIVKEVCIKLPMKYTEPFFSLFTHE